MAAAVGETEKPLWGQKAISSRKKSKTALSLVSIIVKFLLAQGAEKHLFVSDLIIIKGKAGILAFSPSPLHEEVAGSSFFC